MGTVRVEHCPVCGVMVGAGTLYEHQQREHRAAKPEFTQTELAHLLTLLRDHRREGSYYGNRRQHYNRNDRLFSKLEQKWCALTGKMGWPLPSVENRHV